MVWVLNYNCLLSNFYLRKLYLKMRQKGFSPILIVILLALVLGGFLIYQKQIKLVSQSWQITQISPTPTAIDETANWKTYTNQEYGFSIKYAVVRNFMKGCAVKATEGYKTGDVPFGIYEDPDNKILYYSPETVVKSKYKQRTPGSGYHDDLEACKVVSNSLDLIKNGWDNGMGDRSRPLAFSFSYSKINNDEDLLKFGNSVYGTNCDKLQKFLTDETKDIFGVVLHDKDGKNVFGTSCGINATYDFFYSPKNHSAVASSTYQNNPFNDNLGMGYEIEFLNQN